MVLVESQLLGANVHVKSYCDDLRSFVEEPIIDKLQGYWNYILDTCCEYNRLNCASATPRSAVFAVRQMIRIMETYIIQHRPKEVEEGDEPEELELPKDIEDRLVNILVFAAIWGIGGVIDERTRPKFEAFFQQVINGEEVVEAYKLDLGRDDEDNPKLYEATKVPHKLPAEPSSLFDYYFDQEELSWRDWMTTKSRYVVNKEHSFLQLSIPTVDTVRTQHICRQAL
jgi:dynein heavy chain